MEIDNIPKWFGGSAIALIAFGVFPLERKELVCVMKQKRHLQRIIIYIFFFLTFFFSSISVYARGNGSAKVYVTRTGECYHRANCSYLKSSIEMTLEEAHLKYRPCSRCNPPIYSGSSTNIDEAVYDKKGSNSAKKVANSKNNSTTLWIFVFFIAGGGGVYAYYSLKDKKTIQSDNDISEYIGVKNNPNKEAKAYRTPNGNRYHIVRDCPGLMQAQKPIIEYSLKEARKEWRHPCEQCAKREVGIWEANNRR